MTYHMQETDSVLKISFASDLDTVNEVVGEALKFLERNKASYDRFAFKLGLFEGLVNAVKHGNLSNPDLKVDFLIEMCTGGIKVKVTDEGPGFDWHKRFRHSKRSSRAVSGRGMILLQEFQCHPEYNEKGNELSMFFAAQEV